MGGNPLDFSRAEPVIGVVARSGNRYCVDFSRSAVKNLGGHRYLAVIVNVAGIIHPATVVPRRGGGSRVYANDLAFKIHGLKEGDPVSMEMIVDHDREQHRRARSKRS